MLQVVSDCLPRNLIDPEVVQSIVALALLVVGVALVARFIITPLIFLLFQLVMHR